MAPKGWPPGVVYLTSPVYSKKLKAAAVTQLNADPDNAAAAATPTGLILRSAQTSAKVKVTPITAGSHPASGQYGLFAAEHLPPDTLVVTYIGYVHPAEETDKTSDYDLSIDRELGIGVDAARMGNEARFVNDYRGVASAPNAEFRDVWLELAKSKHEKRLGIFVLSAGKAGRRSQGIRKGEEILVSYGKGFWTERQKEATDAAHTQP